MKFNTFKFVSFALAFQLTLGIFAMDGEPDDSIELYRELDCLKQFAHQEIHTVNINGRNLTYNQFANHFNERIRTHTNLINSSPQLKQEFKNTKSFLKKEINASLRTQEQCYKKLTITGRLKDFLPVYFLCVGLAASFSQLMYWALNCNFDRTIVAPFVLGIPLLFALDIHRSRISGIQNRFYKASAQYYQIYQILAGIHWPREPRAVQVRPSISSAFDYDDIVMPFTSQQRTYSDLIPQYPFNRRQALFPEESITIDELMHLEIFFQRLRSASILAPQISMDNIPPELINAYAGTILESQHIVQMFGRAIFTNKDFCKKLLDNYERSESMGTKVVDSEKAMTECPICLEDFTQRNAVSLECGHILHGSCHKELLAHQTGKDVCPICRKTI